jgi:Rrf2 family iron-sulfur cluster assembly transcriptional regulator
LGQVPITYIAPRQHIALSYLEQLFSKLRQHGLVTSVRGPGGGYSICSSANEIALADIVCAVEDGSIKVRQSSESIWQNMTQKRWDTINVNVLEFSDSVTLESLVVGQFEMGVEIEQNPPTKRRMLMKPDQLFAHPISSNSMFELS